MSDTEIRLWGMATPPPGYPIEPKDANGRDLVAVFEFRGVQDAVKACENMLAAGRATINADGLTSLLGDPPIVWNPTQPDGSPWPTREDLAGTHIPAPCRGETCTLCGAQATHKVAEEHLADGWPTHNHSAYVCDEHFRGIFRPTAAGISLLRTAADALREFGTDVILDARTLGNQLERLADLWDDDAERLCRAEEALEALPKPDG